MSERQPDAVCILAAMAVAGGMLTATGYIPDSVASVVPEWLGYLWGAALAASSAVALAGVLWRDAVVSWQLELTGRPGVAGTCLAYAVAVAAGMGSNWGALLAVVVFGAIGVGSLWRCFRLMRRFREVRAVILAERDRLSGDDR